MKIGDKVVCVDDSPCETCGFPVAYKKGEVYVVNKLSIDFKYNSDLQELFIGLVGGFCCKCDDDGTHPASDFRLLTELKSRNTKQGRINEYES